MNTGWRWGVKRKNEKFQGKGSQVWEGDLVNNAQGKLVGNRKDEGDIAKQRNQGTTQDDSSKITKPKSREPVSVKRKDYVQILLKEKEGDIGDSQKRFNGDIYVLAWYSDPLC